MKQKFALTAAMMLAFCSLIFAQNTAAPAAPCEAPSYSGVCDPYVPGIVVFSAHDAVAQVETTWPSGPADQAGVCPGDRLVSVNGTATSGRELMDIVKLLISEKPTPVDLTIKRGDQDFSFHLGRVKETELAALSKEKFTHLSIFPVGDRVVTIPGDESPAEIQAFKNFEIEVGRRNGFKATGSHWVPLATDVGQFERLNQVLNDPLSSRLPRTIHYISGTYQPGFSALLLEHPGQLVAYLIELGSPAFRAGLLPGDEILEVDGHSVPSLSAEQLTDLMMRPDDHAREITLRIRRGTAEQFLKIETEKWRDLGYGFSRSAPVIAGTNNPENYTLGIQLVNPGNPQEMVVCEVAYPSAAFASGMHVGDVIVSLNGQPAKQLTREQIEKLLNPSSPAPLRIDAMRLGRKIHLQLTPMTEAQAEASIGRKMTAHGPASAKCAEAGQ